MIYVLEIPHSGSAEVWNAKDAYDFLDIIIPRYDESLVDFICYYDYDEFKEYLESENINIKDCNVPEQAVAYARIIDKDGKNTYESYDDYDIPDKAQTTFWIDILTSDLSSLTIFNDVGEVFNALQVNPKLPGHEKLREVLVYKNYLPLKKA